MGEGKVKLLLSFAALFKVVVVYIYTLCMVGSEIRRIVS